MKSLQLLAGAIVLAFAIGCSTDPAVEAQQALADGNQRFSQNQFSEAIVFYRKALQANPRLAPARQKLAEAYDRLDDPINAAAEFVRAADLLPDDPDAQVRAGVFLLVGGLFEDAKSRAIKALEANPRHVDALLLLAQATARMKNLDGAIEQVEKALEGDPSEPLVLSTLADLRLAQGDTKAAEAAFKQAVAADPKSVPASLGLGNFYLATGKAAEAEEWLKKAVALEPGNTLANRSLAALYVGTNRLADAEGPLKASAQAASGPTPKLVLADYYAAVNRNDDARQVLLALVDDRAAGSESRLRLSLLEWRENRRSEAHKWVDGILAKGGDISEAALLKGRYLLIEGKLVQARDSMQKSVSANPQLVAAHYWLATTYRSLGDKESARKEFMEVQRLAPGETGSKLQLAQLDLQDGQSNSAETRANEVVLADPRNGVARLALVDARIRAGKLSEALKDANYLATTLPNVPEPQLQLGKIYVMQGNYAAAERAFQRAIEISDGRGDAVGGLVDALIAAGKIQEARGVTDKWLGKNPKETAYLLAASHVQRAAGESDKAKATLNRVLELEPGNESASVDLTNLYLREEKLDDARRHLEAILVKQPTAVWAHTAVAQTFHLQNRTAEARQRYERILEIDPQAAVAANNLAMMLVEEGKSLDRALELAQIAKQQQPDNPNFNDTLGTVYLRKGLASSAVAPFELSARLGPSNPDFHYHLGQAYAQVGRKQDARAALGRALALNDKFSGASDARRLLNELAQNR